MKNAFKWMIRSFISINVFLISWLIIFFGMDLTFGITTLSSVALSIGSYFGIKSLQHRLWLKKQGVSSKDYRYIKKNLDEAKHKVKRLQSVQLKIRSLGAFKQLLEINRLTRRIYQLVRQQPLKFYQAENFFFYHLDSAVELSEKYAYIASQPAKSDEMFISLQETRSLLDDLKDHLEKDLHEILSDDMDRLKFELEFTKKHLSSKKEIK